MDLSSLILAGVAGMAVGGIALFRLGVWIGETREQLHSASRCERHARVMVERQLRDMGLHRPSAQFIRRREPLDE